MENASILDLAPIANTILIVCVGTISIMRVNDMLKRFEKALDRLEEKLIDLDKRLVAVEIHCKYVDHESSATNPK